MNLEKDSEIGRRKQKDTLNYMSITISAEIAMVAAAVLLFFVYLDLPIWAATGGALFAILIGSVLCWQSIVAAEAVFIASVLGAELVVLKYFPNILIPAIIVDILVIAYLATMWNVTERT